MEIQPLPPVQHDVGGHVEPDRAAAEQHQLAGGPQFLDLRLSRSWISGFRLFAGQAEHDRLDTSVPVPGCAEGAEQLGPYAAHLG